MTRRIMKCVQQNKQRAATATSTVTETVTEAETLIATRGQSANK